MNTEQLKNAIDKIDDKYISEAEFYNPETMKIPKSPLIYIAPAAAVAASVVLITAANHFTGTDYIPGNQEINNYQISETTVSPEISVSESFAFIPENTVETKAITGVSSVSESVCSDAQITGTETLKHISTVSDSPVTDHTAHHHSSLTGSEETDVPFSDTCSMPDYTESDTTVTSAEAYVPVSTQSETEPSETQPVYKPGQSPGVMSPEISETTTTESEKEDPVNSHSGPPVPVSGYEHLKDMVNSFNINDYPDIYHESYLKMIETVKSDGFVYMPDDSEGSIGFDDISNIWLLTCSGYEDTGISCFVNYNDTDFQVVFHYTDKEVFSTGTGRDDYFRRRLGIDFSVSYLIGNGVSAGTFGGRECAYSFIDDNHYYIVRTDASRDELIAFIRSFSPEKFSLVQ